MTETPNQADLPPEERETTQPTERTRGEGSDVATEDLELMWVESGLGTDQVALFEQNPSHPDGEAFVGTGPAVQVAKTPLVMDRLNSGALVESSEPKADAPAAPAAAPSAVPAASTPASPSP